jgi:CHASE2 domain-containing sensor protein
MMPAVMLGIVGPLLVAAASWIAAERTWRREPGRLTAVMVTAFAIKLVFFGSYVAFMLSVLSLRPVPFVASFMTSFIALHLAEAFALKRLFNSPRS